MRCRRESPAPGWSGQPTDRRGIAGGLLGHCQGQSKVISQDAVIGFRKLQGAAGPVPRFGCEWQVEVVFRSVHACLEEPESPQYLVAGARGWRGKSTLPIQPACEFSRAGIVMEFPDDWRRRLD